MHKTLKGFIIGVCLVLFSIGAIAAVEWNGDVTVEGGQFQSIVFTNLDSASSTLSKYKSIFSIKDNQTVYIRYKFNAPAADSSRLIFQTKTTDNLVMNSDTVILIGASTPAVTEATLSMSSVAPIWRVTYENITQGTDNASTNDLEFSLYSKLDDAINAKNRY